MKNLIKPGFFIMILIIISCNSDDDSSNDDSAKDCEFSWTDEIVEQAIVDCIDEFTTREECTCVMDKTIEEFTLCEIGQEENTARQIEISTECGLIDCEIPWTEEMKEAAIDECTDENNSVEVCTCAVDTTAENLTVCETLTPEGLAKQLEISFDCGVQPTVD